MIKFIVQNVTLHTPLLKCIYFHQLSTVARVRQLATFVLTDRINRACCQQLLTTTTQVKIKLLKINNFVYEL